MIHTILSQIKRKQTEMCPSKNKRAKDNKNKESRKSLKRKLPFFLNKFKEEITVNLKYKSKKVK